MPVALPRRERRRRLGARPGLARGPDRHQRARRRRRRALPRAGAGPGGDDAGDELPDPHPHRSVPGTPAAGQRRRRARGLAPRHRPVRRTGKSRDGRGPLAGARVVVASPGAGGAGRHAASRQGARRPPTSCCSKASARSPTKGCAAATSTRSTRTATSCGRGSRTRAAGDSPPSGARAHLAGEADLRAPFERLVDTGMRLNELRSAEELHEFLVDEVTELSGAERVLLVLDEPEGPRVACSLLPAGEDADALCEGDRALARRSAPHPRDHACATCPRRPTRSTSARASSRR